MCALHVSVRIMNSPQKDLPTNLELFEAYHRHSKQDMPEVAQALAAEGFTPMAACGFAHCFFVYHRDHPDPFLPTSGKVPMKKRAAVAARTIVDEATKSELVIRLRRMVAVIETQHVELGCGDHLQGFVRAVEEELERLLPISGTSPTTESYLRKGALERVGAIFADLFLKAFAVCVALLIFVLAGLAIIKHLSLI